ncbi:transketolase C-terminal domain-containing protein [Mesorhizobium sp. ORM6]
MVQRALEAAEALAAEGIEIEVIDPRTIMPLDIDSIVASVRKTHRLLIVDEAWAMCGLGGEIAQAINELAFDELDAPPGRLHTAPTSHPFAPVLERAMLVDTARIAQGARDVIAGQPPVPDHWYTVGLKSAAPAKPAPAPAKVAPSAPPIQSHAAAGDDEPITMPFGDLTVSGGTVIKWLKAVGDAVKEGELIAEIETDKAVVEIEASISGTLSAIDQPVGAVVPMGGRIGGIKKQIIPNMKSEGQA